MKKIIFLLCFCWCISACKDDSGSNGTPVVSVEAMSVDEGNTTAPLFLNIRLSEESDLPVSITLRTRDGGAKAGEDYEALDDLPVTFAAGTATVQIPVQIYGDEEAEANESFFVEITSATNVIIGQSSTEIVIRNDDSEGGFIPATGYMSPESYPDRELIWSYEFDDDQVLADTWTFETGTGNNGWGNNEWQYYTQNNAYTIDGKLVIEAREEFVGGRNYTSSRMKSANTFDFKYGRVDIRAALPEGQGIWPALWMLGSQFSSVGWPACGEIDIMELLGHQPNKVYGTVHWQSNGQHASYEGSTVLSSGDFTEEFHVFSIEWDENSIRWLLDNNQYHIINTSESQFDELREPFFFIMNVAVGGNWPGAPSSATVFPQRMVVDYVRVFQ